MCGIAGIVGWKKGAGEQKHTLKLMTDAIAHRGPDGEGHWLDDNGNAALGHRRLSIIDLSDAGSQPMHLEERYSIVFNGEIYNYIELRKDLEKEGVSFRSDSDTEVLLQLFVRFGAGCLQLLDGMFAFAVWDKKEQSLFCARDRFGEKPFFFSEHEYAFFFASEMKALWAAGVPKTINPVKLERFVKQGKVDVAGEMSSTMYTGIHRLDAAHYLIWNNGKKQITRYWTVDNILPQDNITFEDACGKFRTLFETSVSRRLRSDVPVGSSLSGGLDSSAVVCMVNRLRSNAQEQHTFSARFRDFGKDEGSFMEMVASHCAGVVPHYTYPEDLSILEILPQVAHFQEEPFGSSSILAQWDVMRLAKANGVTVLLDGQGADEYLAGYGNEVRIHLNSLFLTNRKRYQKELTTYNSMQPEEKQIPPFQSQENLRMKLGRWKRKLTGQEIQVLTLQDRLKKLVATAGLKELLRYADRNSMAHSREVRLPFLSHELVEFALSLPAEYLIRDGWTKCILRRAMEDIVPHEITWRKDKTGFEPPQSRWMDRPEIREIIQTQQKFFGIDQVKVYKYTNDMNWRLLLSSQFAS